MAQVTDPAILAQLNGSAPQQVTDPSILAQLNGSSAVPPAPTSRLAQMGSNPLVRGAYGLAEGATNMISGMGASAVGGIKGINKLISGGSLDEALQAIRNIQQKYTYQPQTAEGVTTAHVSSAPLELAGNVGKYYGGKVGGALGNEDAGAAIGEAAPSIAATLLMGRGALSKAPAVSNAVRDIPAAASDVVSAITPRVDQNLATLAGKFQDIGGKIPLHTLTKNRYARMAGEAIDNLPWSGSTKEGNHLAINQELIKLMGGDASGELLTPANFGPMMDKSGAAIGDAYAGKSVPLDVPFKRDLAQISSAQRLQVRDVGLVVKGYLSDIKSMAGDTGAIPGEVLRAQDSSLGQRIRGLAPGDLRSQLSDIQETLRDALDRQLTPEESAGLQTNRKQYAIGKQLEPLVAKSAFQGVSPQALMGRETATAAGKSRMAKGAAGETGDLANIGQRFMKEQGSSGTAERIGTLGALMDVGKGAVGLTIGNLYNRLGPVASKAILNRQGNQNRLSNVLK